jgi:very-short-patch-repair endonuclease
MTRLATSQHGVLSSAQLQARGLSRAAISRWVEGDRLHRIHPHVYALGHRALSLEGRLVAALLYAGRGAVLSHTTAAWIWRLIDAEPRTIHITVPSRRRSLPGVRVHHTPQLDVVHAGTTTAGTSTDALRCREFPLTRVPRTLVDIAAALTRSHLRRALAEADYRGLLDVNDLEAELARRRPGSRALRRALRSHMPQLAQTLSALEDRFLELCGSAALPLPEVNARVGRIRVDALWREQHVAVELDGAAAHAGWAAIKRDRHREMVLRSHGFVVARYTWEQVTDGRAEVVADLHRLLTTARPPARGS